MQTYSDYGLHSSAVKLVRIHPQQPNLPCEQEQPNSWHLDQCSSDHCSNMLPTFPPPPTTAIIWLVTLSSGKVVCCWHDCVGCYHRNKVWYLQISMTTSSKSWAWVNGHTARFVYCSLAFKCQQNWWFPWWKVAVITCCVWLVLQVRSVDGRFYVCVSFVFDTAYKKRKVVREPTLR